MTAPYGEGLQHLLEVKTDGEVIPGPAPDDSEDDGEEGAGQ